MQQEISSRKPKKNPDVAEKFGATTMLFDPSAGRLFEMNDTGRAAWSLCDGTKTVEEIAKSVADEYAADGGKVKDDVFAFVLKLKELDLIQL